MANEVHKRLREILADLENPDHLREMVDFYEKLGRPREVEAWSREVARLVAEKLDE